MISQNMIICLLFTLSISICIFMYVHNRFKRVQSNINSISSYIKSLQTDKSVIVEESELSKLPICLNNISILNCCSFVIISCKDSIYFR